MLRSFLLVACAAVAGASKDASQRHAYGHIILRGNPQKVEFFRATFGAHIPCGAHDLIYAADDYGCTANDDVRGKFVVALRGECTFLQKANATQNAGGAGVIVINSGDGLLRVSIGNATEVITIPVVMAPNSSYSFFVPPLKRDAHIRAVMQPVRDSCVTPAAQTQAAAEASVVTADGTVGESAPEPTATPTPAPVSNAPRWNEKPTETALITISLPDDLTAQASLDDQVTQRIEALAASTQAAPIEGVAAMFSGPFYGEPVQLVFAEPLDACTNLTNALYTEGRFIVAYRGACSMIDKARYAQDAGGIGLVIVNNGADPSKYYGNATWNPVAEAARRMAAFDRTLGLNNPDLAVGAIQAIPDDDVKTRPVHIPVLMVSAQAAHGWVWYDHDEGAHGSITGAAITVRPSEGLGAGWEDLHKLSTGSKASTWPADLFQRQMMLQRLLQGHHPLSRSGHPDRYQYLRAVVGAAGYMSELEDMESKANWVDGLDLDAHTEFGRDHTVASVSAKAPASAFLIAHQPVLAVDRDSPDPLLPCRVESGTTYTVRLHTPDYASTANPARRISDLLQQQACLEKLLMTNGAAIGNYMTRLRKDSTVEEWDRFTRAALRHYRFPEDEWQTVIGGFTELASLYDERRPHTDAITVRQWLEKDGTLPPAATHTPAPAPAQP